MGRIIDELNAKMPTFFNLENPEYKAIWGKIDYSPRAIIDESEDYRCGAIANELEYLRSTIDYITKTFDPDDIDGVYLEILVERFAGLERLVNESDEGLRNRFYALFRRGGNPSWIAGSMVLDVLGYFFSPERLYLIENHVGTNLITNGTFETAVGAEWSISTAGSTTLAASTDSPFEESYAMQWDVDASGSAGSLSQTISGCAAGTYTLTFFMQDEGNVDSPLKVSVQRGSDSYYYDFSDNSWGATASGYDVPGTAGEYDLRKLTLINEGSDDLTITFSNLSNDSSVPISKFLFNDDFEPEIGSHTLSSWGAGDYTFVPGVEGSAVHTEYSLGLTGFVVSYPELVAATEFSVSIYYKGDGASSGPGSAIATIGCSSSRLGVDPSVDGFGVSLHSGGVYDSWTIPKNIVDNEWHRLDYVYDGNAVEDNLKIYVDFVLEGSFNKTGAIDCESDFSVVIGAAVRFLFGDYDILRVYDHAIDVFNWTGTGTIQLDYIEFGENKSYPSFRVMAVNSGQSGEFFNMFPDGEDPVSGESYDYDEAGYLDNDHIGGSGVGTTTQYIDEILDIIKPAGVKAEFLPISRAV